ncbi:MAG: hypothetical protein LBR43_02830 [Spiroplasmataceae bacterium]|jgi:gas vesicle protein|nr:hypothetical protein [Spiroplasmataceae bacterium]
MVIGNAFPYGIPVDSIEGNSLIISDYPHLEIIEIKDTYKGHLTKLNEEIKDLTNELLIINKKELTQLLSEIKNKLDESLHDYLEILLESPEKSSISDKAKRNLINKINGNDLQKLTLLQHKVNHLERRISEMQGHCAQVEILPPIYN